MAQLLGEGLEITLFAMAIVFAVLIVLMFIIKIQTSIFSNFNKEDKNIEKSNEHEKLEVKDSLSQSSNYENLIKDEEIVGAIMAALSAYCEEEGTKFRIKNIKRVSENDSNWRRAGLSS